MPRNQQEINPRIRRARVDSLNLYEITEDELTTLEHGSPGSLMLLFAISLLSTSTSFFISLVTTKIESIYTFNIFVIVTAVGATVGVVLLALWYKEYRSSSSISRKIRNRMREETVNEAIQNSSSDPTSTLGHTSSD